MGIGNKSSNSPSNINAERKIRELLYLMGSKGMEGCSERSNLAKKNNEQSILSHSCMGFDTFGTSDNKREMKLESSTKEELMCSWCKNSRAIAKVKDTLLGIRIGEELGKYIEVEVK